MPNEVLHARRARRTLCSTQIEGGSLCASRDVRKWSTARCRAGGCSGSDGGVRRDRGGAVARVGGAAAVQEGRRPHAHHVGGFPDLRRHAGHRDAEGLRPEEGRLQPLPVEPDRAFRHASRRADPFFRERHGGGADSRRGAGGAARGDQRGRQGGEGSRLSALARRSRGLGAPPRAVCPTMPASR